jgi:hypothetical protein
MRIHTILSVSKGNVKNRRKVAGATAAMLVLISIAQLKRNLAPYSRRAANPYLIDSQRKALQTIDIS